MTRSGPIPSAADEAFRVDLWLVDLNSDETALFDAEGWLTPEERLQAGRIRDPRQASRWARLRAILRAILAAQIGCPLDAVAFEHGPSGKPQLDRALPGSSGWHFNLTHSGDYGLLALTRNGPVGVDLERVAPGFEWQPLIHDVCSPSEGDHIREQPPDERNRAFHQLWTRKESLLKAVGIGLGLDCPLGSIEVLPSRVSLPGLSGDGSWFLTDLPAPSGYVASLAAPHPSPALRWMGNADLGPVAEQAGPAHAFRATAS